MHDQIEMTQIQYAKLFNMKYTADSNVLIQGAVLGDECTHRSWCKIVFITMSKQST